MKLEVRMLNNGKGKSQENVEVGDFRGPQEGPRCGGDSGFCGFLKGKVRTVVNCGIDECTPDNLREADYAVVFGGDGSIIAAARQLSRSDDKTGIPVIGVNLVVAH